MTEKENFKFKPLNEGLGFHPFSDGLPYSTKVKTPNKQGSGALSAGSPQFVFPKKNLAPPAAPKLLQSEVQHTAPIGSRMTRVFAYGIDMALHLAITFAFLILAQAGSPTLSFRELLSGDFIVLVVLAFLVLNYALVTSQELIFRTTLGKSLFGLGLSGSTGAILARALLFIPSVCFVGIGILWSLFDSDKMCWHDRATGIAPRKYT